MKTPSTSSAERRLLAKPAPPGKRRKPIRKPGWRGCGAGTPAGALGGKRIKHIWLNKGLLVPRHKFTERCHGHENDPEFYKVIELDGSPSSMTRRCHYG